MIVLWLLYAAAVCWLFLSKRGPLAGWANKHSNVAVVLILGFPALISLLVV